MKEAERWKQVPLQHVCVESVDRQIRYNTHTHTLTCTSRHAYATSLFCQHTKSMWTRRRSATTSLLHISLQKTVGLVCCCVASLPLFWEVFPQQFETSLEGSAAIQPLIFGQRDLACSRCSRSSQKCAVELRSAPARRPGKRDSFTVLALAL